MQNQPISMFAHLPFKSIRCTHFPRHRQRLVRCASFGGRCCCCSYFDCTCCTCSVLPTTYASTHTHTHNNHHICHLSMSRFTWIFIFQKSYPAFSMSFFFCFSKFLHSLSALLNMPFLLLLVPLFLSSFYRRSNSVSLEIGRPFSLSVSLKRYIFLSSLFVLPATLFVAKRIQFMKSSDHTHSRACNKKRKKNQFLSFSLLH